MEMKNVPIRVPVDLHLKVKRRMLDVYGDDNFQKLIVSYLERFAESGSSATVGIASEKPDATGTLKEQRHVSEFLEFLRTGEKNDVHTVLSLIARLSTKKAESDESLQERKLNRR